ncbi:MAG: hypothetical protein CMN30_11840 [Sandaracinus sp.]|nr:hypothetical protein [Sandaracinus sp.]
MRSALLFAVIALSCACTSPRRAPETSRRSEPAPEVPGWPPLPEVRTRAAYTLAELVGELEPLPPADGPAWAEAVFVPWMDTRETQLRRASELRRAARSGSTADQAVAAALHAAVFQATLESLAEARVERIDPAAAEALEPSAQALADKARRAFEICHQLALDGGVELDAWRRRCDERLARLP